MKLAIILIAACSLSMGAIAHTPRSGRAKAEFQKLHPCPSTGLTSGACPGWIKDHRIALACGGLDKESNLQWQTIADAKAKDKWERIGCK